ncbi:MAG: ATP-binding protein [Planctomycetota bacterium]
MALHGGRIEALHIPVEDGVVGNRDLLLEALDNLVGNAVEHGDPNGVVEIRVERRGKYHSLLVKDEGGGIADADREKVFDRFHRGEGSRKRRGEGTGLGLWIARRIAKRYGGRLQIEDTSPAGTTMRLDLLPGSEGRKP